MCAAIVTLHNRFGVHACAELIARGRSLEIAAARSAIWVVVVPIASIVATACVAHVSMRITDSKRIKPRASSEKKVQLRVLLALWSLLVPPG